MALAYWAIWMCSIVTHINDTLTNALIIFRMIFLICAIRDYVDVHILRSTKTFLGYTLRPAIQLNATIDAINPTKLKNLKSAYVDNEMVLPQFVNKLSLPLGFERTKIFVVNLEACVSLSSQ